ncbi:TOG array regulator of axonemal microtubules protein 2 [Diaphorina citri]|uniref:TOG array regulator of axonemal microtubules protein 2 n=1 Tax=Diaphorina citri TaxID=121845 RepID=A0A3Q0JAF0_DIACI|nr:TOG array regulator of axonemal microtubules protein 2 [Diaphorina citri]
MSQYLTNAHNSSTGNNVEQVQDKKTLTPNRIPKKSPNRTPTKLPKSIHSYSSNKSLNNNNNNSRNQNNHNVTVSTTNACNKTAAPKMQQLYPESLPPFEKPKEALSKTLAQLESSDWEATMQGLQGLVRITRHHTKLLAGHLHSVCTQVAKQVRSLRSQVARAACQTATVLFTILSRQLEPELEELAKVLLSRTADTNKFLRADCYAALVAMVNCIQPIKTIPVILVKGAK